MKIEEIEELIVIERGARKLARKSLIGLYGDSNMSGKEFRKHMNRLGYSKNHVDLLL